MPAVAVPVNVNVNFNGVSCNNGVWSGTPSWNVAPPTVQVHPGTNTINWNLNAQAPSGYTAKYAPMNSNDTTKNPIYFPVSSNWTGGSPQRASDTLVTATDNFSSITQPTDYYYGVNVTLTQTSSGASNTFNYDPEVENEPN
jgi:hypothetical protein